MSAAPNITSLFVILNGGRWCEGRGVPPEAVIGMDWKFNAPDWRGELSSICSSLICTLIDWIKTKKVIWMNASWRWTWSLVIDSRERCYKSSESLVTGSWIFTWAFASFIWQNSRFSVTFICLNNFSLVTWRSYLGLTYIRLALLSDENLFEDLAIAGEMINQSKRNATLSSC